MIPSVNNIAADPARQVLPVSQSRYRLKGFL